MAKIRQRQKYQDKILQSVQDKLCTDRERELLEDMGLPVTAKSVLFMMEKHQAESSPEIIDYSQRHSVATSISECMYGLFLTQPVANIDNQHRVLNISQHINELRCCKETSDWIVDDFTLRIFRGVNKRLELPCVISKLILELELPAFKAKNVVKESSVFLFQACEVVRFNVKNLIKYYNYPEKDAKAFYANLAIYNQSTPLYLPKNTKHKNRELPVTYDNTGDVIKVFWDIPTKLVDEFMLEYINHESSDHQLVESDLCEILNMLDKPLPIEDLSFWKILAKQFYMDNGEDWSAMSVSRQKRLLTNFIRHNIPGYSQAYQLNDRALAKRLHDDYFDLVMRRIARTFPYLANECNNQWSYREGKNNNSDGLIDNSGKKQSLLD
ncbi:hypothetical protein [Photobacterium iliopiscarium]|uniref:hypothetical protein n=1 Tax=Photobacterium iliopiscarium TaxID=56192 RepID=UPI001E325079|nr:hypothetical protein [Photobacterium iliopiscarium]MCD9485914.1 hypothetical protein [Photobacterium iliopiscarium]MCF2242611.1 hypothetical protein [Photobacterium iliopiscarium]